MTPESSNRGHRAGFTLIELLVVVAIIALLISILLPSLQNAREQGRAVVCGTDLESIFKGIMLYTQDYKEVLPHFGYIPDVSIKWWWPTQISKYIACKTQLLKCPSDKYPDQFKAKMENRKLTYLAWDTTDPRAVKIDNTYKGSCDLLSDDIKWKVGGVFISPMPRRVTDFIIPAYNLLLVEGLVPGDSAPGGCTRISTMLSGIDLVTTNDGKGRPIWPSWRRHTGRTNILFVDGHVVRLTAPEVGRSLSAKQQFHD